MNKFLKHRSSHTEAFLEKAWSETFKFLVLNSMKKGVLKIYRRTPMPTCDFSKVQKKPPRGVLKKRCSESMQQIYRRTSMPKCDFNKIVSNFIEVILWHGSSPVNLLHIFRTPFSSNTSGWPLSRGCNFYINKLWSI